MGSSPHRRIATALVACLAVAAMSACGDDEDKSTGSASGGTTVKLSSAEGQAAGSVSLAPKEGGVEIRAEVTGLRPGFHGFHIHETGTCDRSAAEGPFETAGGHFAVGEQDHGDHAGDMPPLLADEEGTATATFITTRFDIEELKGGDGSAVMVHASRDNQGNVPNRYRAGGKPGPDAETLDTGDTGDRLACGVLR